jgi:hypothetical protein
MREGALQRLKTWLGFNRGEAEVLDAVRSLALPLPEPEATNSNRFQPLQTGANRFSIASPVPTRRWVPPPEHAAAIIDFLQGAGGRTGTITAREMAVIHREVCEEYDYEPIGWVAVGRELRKLLGADRNSFAPDTNGKRVRVYRIPPASWVDGPVKAPLPRGPGAGCVLRSHWPMIPVHSRTRDDVDGDSIEAAGETWRLAGFDRRRHAIRALRASACSVSPKVTQHQ